VTSEGAKASAFRLEGKVAVITGGGSGIGQANASKVLQRLLD
jgi:NAD(P)-dependent dehydrogenase (short-subunit alcohol dehydrogenase family)